MNHMLSQLQNTLRRSTAVPNTWLSEVDGLRFVAILAVLLQHLLERFTRHTSLPLPTPVLDDPFAFFISRGTVGVFLFFAISGFVLALPFARYHLEGTARPGLKTYLLRRVTRLEPPYLIWMVVFAGVLLLKGAYSFPELFPHLLASLTYTHSLFFSDYSPINPVSWSLEVEIQFYLLAPFLAALFFSIRNRIDRQSALVFSMLGWIVLQQHFGWLELPYKLSLLGQLPHFLVGFLIADLYLSDWKKAPRQHLAWDVAALLAYPVMCYSWTTEFWKNLVFAGALFVLFAAAFRGIYFRKILQNGWIAVAGGMCYTVYLIHLPLLEAMTTLSGNLVFTNSLWVNFLLQSLLWLPLVWLLGALFFVLLEKPFMRVTISDWRNMLPVFSLSKTGRRSRSGVAALLLIVPLGLQAQSAATPATISTPTTEKTTPDSLQLRPIAELLQQALLNAPELHARQKEMAKQSLVADVQRKSWAEMFSMSGTAYYGNGVVNEVRSVDGSNVDFATGRLGAGINLTLGVKINGADLTTRRQKTQIQVLQLERLEDEKQAAENAIRDEVTAQYFQLENVLSVVQLRAEALENLRLTRSVAEKYFREGALPLGEYSSLLAQESNANEQFLRIKNEAKLRSVALGNLTGAEIWK